MPRGNRRFDRITTSPVKKYHPYTAAEPKKFAYILNSHIFGNDPEASSSQKPKGPSRKAARADPAPQPTHSVSLAMPSGRVTTYRFGPGRSEPGFSGTGPVQSEPNAAFPRPDDMSESPLPPLVSRKSRATPWEPTPGRRLENSNNATYSRCRSSSPNSKSPSSPDRRNRPLRTRYDTSHRVPGSPSWDYEHARSGEDRSGHYPRDPCGTLPNTRSSGFRTTDRPSSQGTFRRCLPSVESIPGGSLPKPPLCSPSSTSPSRPSLSDEQNSQPTHSVTSSQFHSYPTSVPLQPAFDPTPRSIIPLPKFHRCFTIQQLCGTAEDSEPSWASEVAIIQGAPIRAVQSLAPTLEAEVLVNRWRNEASNQPKRAYRQAPIRVIAVNTQQTCSYNGTYASWVSIKTGPKLSLLKVPSHRRDNLDFTRRPVSFDPLRLHLALIERRPPFTYLRAPIINIDLLPVTNDANWAPSIEWREKIMGSESNLMKLLNLAQGIVSRLCNAEILPSHQEFATLIRYETQQYFQQLFLSRMVAETEDYHKDTVLEAERHIAELRAIIRYCLMVCLDASAILGGTELPIWPINELAIGTIFDASDGVKLEVHDSSLSLTAKAFASTLERWGIPHWRVQLGDKRFAVCKSCPPMVDAASEAALQREIRGRAQSTDRKDNARAELVVGFDFIVTETVTCSRPQQSIFAGAFDPTTEQFLLERCILALAPLHQPLQFSDFSNQMKWNLKGIWLGLRYEEGQHDNRGLVGGRWKNIRVPFPIGAHPPLMRAFTTTPISYYHPEEPLPTWMQTTPLVDTSIAPSPLTPPTIRSMTDIWYGTSIRLSGAALELEDDLEAVKERGVLAYRKVRDVTVNPQVSGWDRSTHCLNLLCKTTDSSRRVKQYLQTTFPHTLIMDLSMCDYTPTGYIGVFELGFVGEVFARGFNQTLVSALMARAPAALVPQGPDTSPEETTQLWKRMYSEDLFEYGRFKILETTSDTGRKPFNLVEVVFGRDLLERMCMCRPIGLNESEYHAFLRFCLMLCRLARFKRPFRQRIYPSEGSLYPRVLNFISNEATQLFDGFNLRSNETLRRSGRSPQGLFESIRWQPRHACYALEVAEDPLIPRNKPTQAELEGKQRS